MNDPIQQPPSNSEPKTSQITTFRGMVKDGLLHANDTVRASLVADEVKKEVDRRTKAAASVIEQIESTELEIRKVKPTPVGYTSTGAAVGEVLFTKEQVEGLKKANEKLARLNNALEKALNENDFSKTFELSGGK